MEEGSAAAIVPTWYSLLELVQIIEHNFETLHLDRGVFQSLLLETGLTLEELNAKLQAGRQNPQLIAESAAACRAFREPLDRAFADACTEATGGSPKELMH